MNAELKRMIAIFGAAASDYANAPHAFGLLRSSYKRQRSRRNATPLSLVGISVSVLVGILEEGCNGLIDVRFGPKADKCGCNWIVREVP
jgi:hypothetical protein